jgi:hypothetical protein
MARMLRETQSTHLHLNASRRHGRLCGKVKGAQKFEDAIKPSRDALVQKQNQTGLKTEEKEDGYDDLMLADAELDDAIRTAFEKCMQFNRDNPGQSLLLKIFPDQKYTDVTMASWTKEPDLAEQVAVRFDNLGPTHPLTPVGADLRTKIASSRAAIAAYYEAIRRQKVAEAEEEIAQAELRRQYEANYLDARKEFGREIADKLFPKVSLNGAQEEIPAGTTETKVQTSQTV